MIGVVYVIIGDRDLRYFRKSINSLSSFNLPIVVYSNISIKGDFELRYIDKIPYTTREANRNSSYYRLMALRDSPFDRTVYMDNDLVVVSDHFLEGFDIAKKFGIAMPISPRHLVKKELKVALDVSDYDKKFFADKTNMTICNAGLIFACNNRNFFDSAAKEQLSYPSRGNLGIIRAFWRECVHPYVLPLNWLVCRDNVDISNPITLHIGHSEVESWWKSMIKF